jgi:hypothetical protein
MSPARSKKQKIAMAIAEHAPEKLYSRNKGLKKMSKKQLHDFASTSEKGLPEKVKKPKSESVASFIKRRNKKRGNA